MTGDRAQACKKYNGYGIKKISRHTLFLFMAFLLIPTLVWAQCTLPPGNTGMTHYDSSRNEMQYCNGTNWIAFPKNRQNPASCTVGPWTSITSNDGINFLRVVFYNGLFIAATNTGILTSTDGVTWVNRLNDGCVRDIAAGNNMLVAIQGYCSGQSYISTDGGLTWNPSPAGTLPNYSGQVWMRLYYADGVFIAGTDDWDMTHSIIVSSDGLNWAPHKFAGGWRWDGGGAEGNGRIVLGSTDSRSAVSTDGGLTWNTYATPRAIHGLAFGNGVFVSVQDWGQLMTSFDGEVWTPLPNLGSSHHWRSIIYAGDIFLALGEQNTGAPSPLGIYATSVNGTDWDIHNGMTNNPWRSAAFGNGLYLAVSYWDGTGRVTTAPCLAAPCNNPSHPAGTIIFNENERVLQWCGGGAWQAAGPVNPGGPNSGCSNPSGDAGRVIFNQGSNILQYCDGGAWRGIGRPSP